MSQIKFLCRTIVPLRRRAVLLPVFKWAAGLTSRLGNSLGSATVKQLPSRARVTNLSRKALAAGCRAPNRNTGKTKPHEPAASALPLSALALLSVTVLSASCGAQSPPPAPRNISAWQPPVTQATVDDRFPSFGQPKTALVELTELKKPEQLKPPRDIFTQRPPQPQERFAARPLSSSFPQSASNSEFNLPNTMSEAFGGAVAKANLESSSPFPESLPRFSSPASADPLAGFADTAAEKIGGMKDWMADKTAGFLNSQSNNGGGWLERLSSMLGGADLKKIGGSLSIVLGGYLGLVWLLRKINPAGNQGIPTEVLEVVGNAPLDNRQNLQLVRLGSKLLLMIHGPDGTQPIGEVTDPAEVEHLVALCNGRTRTAHSAVSNAVHRHQSNQTGGSTLNLSANQQSNLSQLLSALDLPNRGNASRSFEA